MQQLTKWSIDSTHSEIGFKVKHMMFTNVNGRFTNFNAEIENPSNDFENGKIHFQADVNSVNTSNSDRDNHLRSGDFFDTNAYPNISFNSSKIRKINEGKFEVEGDLTIKNVTKSVTLEADYSGELKDPWGNTKIALAMQGKINRKDFGLTWNAALETGGVLVGEDIKLDIETQFVKQ